MATADIIAKAATTPSLVRDIAFPAAALGGSAAVGAATGFNPVTGTFSTIASNPIDASSFMFLTNPFQSWQANEFKLSRAGLYGARTLIRGVAAGGKLAAFSPGGVALSAIQGTARSLAALGLMPGETSKLGTAFRHARRVGLAGLLSPSQVVLDINANFPGMKGKNTAVKGFGDKIRKKLTQPQQPGTLVRRLRHLAGAGHVTADDISKEFVRKYVSVEIGKTKGGAGRAVLPRYLADKAPKGISLTPISQLTGVSKAWGVTARLGMAGFSTLTWVHLTTMLAKPAVSALVAGASGLAITAMDMLRSINEPELARYRNMEMFMGGEAATERQRAVQAIYGAKINPANRFLGNEARMYHS